MSLIFCVVATLALVNAKPAILPVSYNAFPTFNSAVPYGYATNIIAPNQFIHNAIPYSTIKFEPVAPPAQVLTPAVQYVSPVDPVVSSSIPHVLTHGVRAVAVNPISPIISKYHAQAEDGSYSFGYHGGPSSRAETRDAFGIVRGAYNYVDSEGKVQTQQYVADGLGFRVSGTDIPVAPEAPVVPQVKGPEPVDDTPEVKEAKAKFFELFKKAEEGIVDEAGSEDGVEVVNA